MKNNPYVGPPTYERGDEYKFYGRNREAGTCSRCCSPSVGALLRQIWRGENLAPERSGYSTLEKTGFVFLPVTRVSGDVPPGVAPDAVQNVFVFSVLMALAGASAAPAQLCTGTLTSCLQALCQRPDTESEGDVPFLLIEDQFEELFTTHRDRWRDAEGFFLQVRDALEALPGMGSSSRCAGHVAELDPYALVPKRARYLVLGGGALEALARPALDRGIHFVRGVAERLVGDLPHRVQARARRPTSRGRNDDRSVCGTVHLQVVCSRL